MMPPRPDDSHASLPSQGSAATPIVWIFHSPKAGSGRGRTELRRLTELLDRAGREVRSTSRIDELRDAIATADRSAIVVTAGGDGTLTMVAATLPPGIPLLPMPLGTENLVARHFGHSASATAVLAAIESGPDVTLDAGLVTRIDSGGRPLGGCRLFLAMITAGYDAAVVRQVHLRRRGHIRRWTYVLPMLRELTRYAFPVISVRSVRSHPGPDVQADADRDGDPSITTQGRWAMIFNLPCYAGSLPILPAARGDDGRLDVVCLATGGWRGLLRYLIRIKRGTHLSRPGVAQQHGTEFTVTAPARVPYQLDGDYVGHLPVHVQTLPARVTLRLPAVPS